MVYWQERILEGMEGGFMKRDLYSLLGLESDASMDLIESAYRKLVSELFQISSNTTEKFSLESRRHILH